MEKIDMESVARVLDQGKELTNQLKVKLHGIIKSEEDDCYNLITQVASSIDHALEKLGCMPLSASNELGLTNSTTGGDNHKVQRFTDKKRKALPTRSVQVKFSGKETEGLLDDGFQWRKYGQKKILNAKYPRAYYRCKNRFTQQCPAKKYVQRRDDDSSFLDIEYQGSHTCEQEKAKKPQKNPILYTKQEDQWQPDPGDELLFYYDTTKTESVAFETQFLEDIIGERYSTPSPCLETGFIESFYCPNQFESVSFEDVESKVVSQIPYQSCC